jgi:hypothetical protein
VRHLFQNRIRHPFFPDLAATPAGEARGRCAAVAGGFDDLARAAAAGVEARRAVYLLSHANQNSNEGQREALWRLFRVPVYGLLMEGGGRIVAWECEAQNGLHVEGSGAAGLGLREESPCACGRPGARVLVTGAVPAGAD